MSVTSTTARVTDVTATSATGQPFTVTATIETDRTGPFLRVTVDGEGHRFDINPHWLRIEERTETDEGTRLLQRHLALQTVGDWTETRPGALTATVAEITGRCNTCVNGCLCEFGGDGCGHFGCFAADDTTANTCPGAAIHLEARRPKRRIARQRGTR